MTQIGLALNSFLVAFVFCVLLNGIAMAEDKYTAEEMLSDCQTILSSAKSMESSGELELDNTFSTGNCWGAFQSLQQLVVTKIEGSKRRMLQVCVPPETTLLQMIQIFSWFAASHPERQQEPFTKVAIAALRSAYPCK